MAERDVISAIRAEPDAAKKITMYTRHLAEGSPRPVPLQLLARAAAGVDRAATAVWAQMRQESLTAMTYFAGDLIATGQVRTSLSAEETRDILFTYHSAAIYESLVMERGWSTDRYARFLADAMISAVLG